MLSLAWARSLSNRIGNALNRPDSTWAIASEEHRDRRRLRGLARKAQAVGRRVGDCPTDSLLGEIEILMTYR